MYARIGIMELCWSENGTQLMQEEGELLRGSGIKDELLVTCKDFLGVV